MVISVLFLFSKKYRINYDLGVICSRISSMTATVKVYKSDAGRAVFSRFTATSQEPITVKT